MAPPGSRAPLRPRDLLRAVGVDDPQVHPDGSSVVWRRTSIDADRDRTLASLVVQPLGLGPARVLVPPRPGVRTARWSPDGRWLAFVAPLAEAAEVFLVPAEGGEARQLTALGGPIDDIAWSPRGDALALVLPRHLGAEPEQGFNADVLRVTRLRWKRDGVGLIGDRFDQLALVPVAPGAEPIREPRWLVTGRADVAGPSWSPDGARLAFVASLDDPAWERTRRSSVYVLEVDRRDATPRRLSTFADLRASTLAWSPDGRHIALTGHARDGIGHYGAQRLWLVDSENGARRALTDDVVGTFGNAAYTDTGGSGAQGPVWTAKGDALLAVLSARSTVRLVRVSLAGEVTPLTPAERVVAGFDVAPGDRHAVVVAQPRDRSADIELVDLTTDVASRHGVRLSDEDRKSVV